jgi:hypothetical protein
MTSSNNLKQMSLALHNIASTYDGKLPPAYGGFTPSPNANWQNGGSEGPIFFHMLPYIEQDNMWKSAATGTNGHLGAQLEWAGLPRIVKTFIAPSDPSNPGDQPLTSYRTNGLAFTVPPGDQTSWQGPRLPGSFSDGTSNTISFAEAFGHMGTNGSGAGALDAHWYFTLELYHGYIPNGGRVSGPTYFPAGPPNYTNPPIYTGVPQNISALADYLKPAVLSTGGVQVGLMDGSVRRVSSGISPATWYLASHPSDGLTLPSDW